MKRKLIFGLTILLVSLQTFTSCTRVAPNYVGVLMENYGKNGKSDFTLQKGNVWTVSPGIELFQVPLWEQRATFADNDANKILHLKAADNTEFSSSPIYSFKVIEKQAIDVVFENKQLENESFMKSLEDNILETKIYDLMKNESRKYVTDSLMANGGSLRYENDVEKLVREAFREKGLELLTFTAQLDFTDKVKAKIDNRNEVNTNLSVIDQEILQQKKKNELAALQRDYNKIQSEGITEQLLRQQFIEKWDGSTPLYGNVPVTLFKQTQ